MHVNRGLLFWGIFFIALGAVPLLVRAGYLGEDVVLRAWSLWPLILIGIGLGLMLRRTRASLVGGLVVAVTAGMMFGSLLAVGVQGIGSGGLTACGFGVGNGGREPFADQQGSLGGSASVRVELDCGELDLTTAAGNDWMLTGTSRDGLPPDISHAADRLVITPTSSSDIRVGFGSARGVEWNLRLPQAPLTRLDLSVNAGSATARLDSMVLQSVQASVNAGSATLDLASAISVDQINGSVNAGALNLTLPAANVTGSLSANAGTIHLCVPDGVDLRIRVTDNALGSTNFGGAGLTKVGDTWTTANFGAGVAQIDLSASANLGSIDLNPENGCE